MDDKLVPGFLVGRGEEPASLKGGDGVTQS